ncbi:MAG: hypothetical protein FWH11_10255 [Micrococcales bacterium]|nr:hypothetical protein [Micrococcales bacterium]
MIKTRTALAVVFAVALSMALAGCAPDGGTTPTETAATAPTTSSAATDETAPAEALVIDDPDAATCWFRVGIEDAAGQVLMTGDDSAYICFVGSTFSWVWPSEQEDNENREGTWTADGSGYLFTTTGGAMADARIDDDNLFVKFTTETGKTRVDVFALYGLCPDVEACLADPTWQVGRD